MSRVKASVVVYSRLIAQYGNFRVHTMPNGSTIRIPAVYNFAVFEFPPATIDLPEMEFEYFNDNIEDILDIMEYNDQYLKLKRYLSHVDTSKLSIPDTIPVSEVPVEYVSFRHNSYNKNIITPNGIQETEHDPYDIRGLDIDDEDDDPDSSDDDMEVESVIQYLSPSFIYQSMNWHTIVDIGSFGFVEEKAHTIDDKVRERSTPIQMLLRLGLTK